MPESLGINWMNDSRVGFQSTLLLTGNKTLDVLVEKDFICLDREPKLHSDQFPNPKSKGSNLK
jgi:hypothetical protein